MIKWELITEIKDSGYYIGWRRAHKMIHMPEPRQPMSKSSLVQIGGKDGDFRVRGLTYAHNIFEPHKAGLKLYDETHHVVNYDEAHLLATGIKKTISRLFDGITRSDNTGKLILREARRE